MQFPALRVQAGGQRVQRQRSAVKRGGAVADAGGPPVLGQGQLVWRQRRLRRGLPNRVVSRDQRRLLLLHILGILHHLLLLLVLFHLLLLVFQPLLMHRQRLLLHLLEILLPLILHVNVRDIHRVG